MNRFFDFRLVVTSRNVVAHLGISPSVVVTAEQVKEAIEIQKAQVARQMVIGLEEQLKKLHESKVSLPSFNKAHDEIIAGLGALIDSIWKDINATENGGLPSKETMRVHNIVYGEHKTDNTTVYYLAV